MKKPRLQLLGLPRCKRNHIRPAQIKRQTELWLYFPNFGSSVTRKHFLPTWLNKPVSFPSFLSTQRSKWEKDFPLFGIYSHCERPQSVPSVYLGRETADEEGVGGLWELWSFKSNTICGSFQIRKVRSTEHFGLKQLSTFRIFFKVLC